MGRETRLFKSEERMSRSDAARFLRDLADKLEAGAVTMRRGADELRLEMPPTVVVEVQAEDEDKRSKGIQHSLEVEIKWFDDDAAGGPLKLG